MKIFAQFCLLSVAIVSFFKGAVGVQAQTLETQVNEVVEHLVGVMDTSAQAQANPQAPDVRMTTCWVELSGVESQIYSVFLYQEQALSDNLSQPYRQRFLEITPGVLENKVESLAFRPVQPQRWINFCDRPIHSRRINLDDLGEATCPVSLRKLIDVYVGETPSEGCVTNVRGAVRMTNTVILHSQGMDTYDRGFDQQGNQVWGAENQGYQFRWLNLNQ